MGGEFVGGGIGDGFGGVCGFVGVGGGFGGVVGSSHVCCALCDVMWWLSITVDLMFDGRGLEFRRAVQFGRANQGKGERPCWLTE